MDLCHICGNQKAVSARKCPFCGAVQESCQSASPSGVFHKTVNLEEGHPIVEVALRRLNAELATARQENYRLLTFIHGYGSSGSGGAIGRECRKTLEYLCRKGELNGYILGEEFNRKSGPVRALLHRYPQLRSNRNLNLKNRGITLVIL